MELNAASHRQISGVAVLVYAARLVQHTSMGCTSASAAGKQEVRSLDGHCAAARAITRDTASRCIRISELFAIAGDLLCQR